jgi:exodeoxyribonuclease VII large subunit
VKPVRTRSSPPEPAPEGQLSLDSRFAAPPAPAAPAPTPPTPTAAPAAGRAAARVEPPVLAVSELVRAARVVLEARFADVRVEGEISGLKRSGNGHLYFCLKDAEAQLECVMFSREAGRLRFKVVDGLQVRCRGRLTIFEGRGRFQMTVTGMEPAGAGALALAFEQLKQKLAAEGLFDPARKRRLPFLPRRIGVVTSPQGAVIRDIVRIAHRRGPVSILLAPAAVQGATAPQEIITSLRQLATIADIELVIVARGGGSLEDLWAFNDEGLARVIAAYHVPVISAVGHETDFTISDFVADVRAPTPSAAAELAVPVASELLGELAILGRRLGRGAQAELRARRLGLERMRARVGDPRRLIDQRRQLVDELGARGAQAVRADLGRHRVAVRALEARLFRAHPQRRIADQRAALAALERRLVGVIGGFMGRRRRVLEGISGKVEALSPLKVLERGYSLARGPDGRLLTSAAGLAPGDAVKVTLRDGELDTRVESVRTPGSGGDGRGEDSSQ